MKLSSLVSPGTWELIERLRPHLDVTIDLFDSALSPVLPERNDAPCRQLRALTGGPVRPGEDLPGTVPFARDRFLVSLRSGNSQLFASDGLRVGLFPLRHDRAVVGILATAVPMDQQATPADLEADVPGTQDLEHPLLPFGAHAPGALPGSDERGAVEVGATAGPRAPHPLEHPIWRRIERLGWSLRGTIESDIETHQRLGDEQERSRWLATTLRFLEHLHACETDRELAGALVEAAAIWGDADARLYRRQLDGTLALHTALPAVEASATPRVLPASVLSRAPDATRITSIAELDQIGWTSGTSEVLFLTVPSSGRPEWLLAVAGRFDAGFERVLGVACRTLGSRFEELAVHRQERLRERLATRLALRDLPLGAQAASVLAELATATRAVSARLLAGDAARGPLRTLAAIGGSLTQPPHLGVRSLSVASAPISAAAQVAPTRMVFAMDTGLPRPVLLELGAMPSQPFDAGAAALAQTGADVIRPWLAGALGGLAARRFGLDEAGPGAGFEDRIHEEIERARRFDLRAGLVLIDTVASSRERHAVLLRPVIDTARSLLRGADRLGRLEEGELAILLVHTDSHGVDVAAARLATRLSQLARQGELPETVLGCASYPDSGETVEVLLEAARRDRARRLEVSVPGLEV